MKKLRPFIVSLTAGLLITVASLIVNFSSTFPDCSGLGAVKAEKGLPIPYVHIQPSVSICNSVSSIAVFWQGNAAHEEYSLAFTADLVFWSLVAFGILKFKQHP